MGIAGAGEAVGRWRMGEVEMATPWDGGRIEGWTPVSEGRSGGDDVVGLVARVRGVEGGRIIKK